MNDKIEGVPEGWRLVRIGKPKAGEYYIEINGEACEAKLITPTVLQWVFPIVEKIIKYRELTTDDIGKIVEINLGKMVEVNIVGYWYERKLLAILPDKFKGRYIFEREDGNDWSTANYARIKD